MQWSGSGSPVKWLWENIRGKKTGPSYEREDKLGSSEVIWNESQESNLLILGKAKDVKNVDRIPTLDAKTCTAVLMPSTAKTEKAVLLYADTEHLNPKGRIRSRIYLIAGVNTLLEPDTLEQIQGVDPTYVAYLKRVFATPGGRFFEGEKVDIKTAGRISNADYKFLRLP